MFSTFLHDGRFLLYIYDINNGCRWAELRISTSMNLSDSLCYISRPASREKPKIGLARQTSSGGSSNSPSVEDLLAHNYSEYRGPAAYQKPSGKSNKKITLNAVAHCCLCGEVNKDSKEKCLQVRLSFLILLEILRNSYLIHFHGLVSE